MEKALSGTCAMFQSKVSGPSLDQLVGRIVNADMQWTTKSRFLYQIKDLVEYVRYHPLTEGNFSKIWKVLEKMENNRGWLKYCAEGMKNLKNRIFSLFLSKNYNEASLDGPSAHKMKAKGGSDMEILSHIEANGSYDRVAIQTHENLLNAGDYQKKKKICRMLCEDRHLIASAYDSLTDDQATLSPGSSSNTGGCEQQLQDQPHSASNQPTNIQMSRQDSDDLEAALTMVNRLSTGGNEGGDMNDASNGTGQHRAEEPLLYGLITLVGTFILGLNTAAHGNPSPKLIKGSACLILVTAVSGFAIVLIKQWFSSPKMIKFLFNIMLGSFLAGILLAFSAFMM